MGLNQIDMRYVPRIDPTDRSTPKHGFQMCPLAALEHNCGESSLYMYWIFKRLAARNIRWYDTVFGLEGSLGLPPLFLSIL